MYAICFRYSKTKEEAEDTFHEGFIKVFNNIHKYNGTGSLESWMKRIMVNTAIDKYRKSLHAIPEHKVEIGQLESSLKYNSNIVEKLNAEELMKLVHKLPPAYRMVFNLFAIEGFKHREIAEQLGISEGTSKSNLSDARLLLQKELKKISEGSDHNYIHERRK